MVATASKWCASTWQSPTARRAELLSLHGDNRAASICFSPLSAFASSVVASSGPVCSWNAVNQASNGNLLLIFQCLSIVGPLRDKLNLASKTKLHRDGQQTIRSDVWDMKFMSTINASIMPHASAQSNPLLSSFVFIIVKSAEPNCAYEN